jgi:hypothetical protein|tara:strand:+ start:143 stop:1045 length:903 start_codon:yes stop_codon:yes gene_type:complete
MAGTLKLTDIAHSSGAGTITVDSLATLAISTGKLTVGGTAIETGAQGVLSKTATYTILAGDFTGKSSLIVLVDVSAGTSTETIITLPAAADFSTCAIHVASTAAHGAGNTIAIKNGSSVEQYTLYGIGDHCEFVSDGTNVFRTGNEHLSASGLVYRNTLESIPGNGTELMFSTGEYTVYSDLGSWFDTTNFWVNVPFACSILVQALTSTSNTDRQHITPVIKRLYSSRASTEIIFNPSAARAGDVDGQPNGPCFTWDFTAGDDIEWYMFNNHNSVAYDAAGSANGYYIGCYAKWTVLRRY